MASKVGNSPGPQVRPKPRPTGAEETRRTETETAPETRPKARPDGFGFEGAPLTSVPVPKPRPDNLRADPELAALVNGARTQSHLGRHTGGFNPVDTSKLASATADSVSRLTPGQLNNVDGLGMLDSVQDGRVQLEVPMKAGTYEVGGHNVRVKPGTRALVNAEVKDGKLVPVGQSPTGGTRVQIDPPLDGPAHVVGKGVYVSGKGGQGQVVADLGGWFDQKLGEKGDLGVGATVKRMQGAGGEKGGSPLTRMLDLGNTKFRADSVRLKDDRVDLGSVKVDVGQGTRVSMAGDGDRAELRGKVNVDGASVRQDGLDVQTGRGTADLHVTAARQRDGGLDVRARMSDINADVKRFEARAGGGANADRLALEDAHIRNGDVNVRMRVSPDGRVGGTSSSATADVEGRIAPSQLTVADGDGTATLRVAADKASGTVRVGDGHIALDGKLDNADLALEGYQSDNQGSAIDLHHARVKGDASVSLDTGTGAFDAEVRGRDIDVRLDDYKGGDAGVSADLGRTDVTGSGTLKVGSTSGLSVEGDLQVKGRIDDLQVQQSTDGGGGAKLDVAPGSTVDGTMRRLAVSDAKGFELDATMNVDMGLENYSVDLPGVSASGDARLQGRTDMRIGDGRVQMDGHDVKARVNVADGKIAPGGDQLSLDMAAGSTMDLSLKHARYTGGDGAVEVQVGAGSRIDAKLDGGHVKAGDYEVTLDEGARARLDVNGMRLSSGGVPELNGTLEIEAGGAMSADGLKHLEKRGAAVQADGNTATGKLTIGDVTLTRDGELRAQNVDLQMEGKVGTFTAVTKGEPQVRALDPDHTDVPSPLAPGPAADARTARRQPVAPALDAAVAQPEKAPVDSPEQARLRTLLDDNPTLETNQHLINHFYKEGGRDWGQGTQLAAEHGVDMNAITDDRGGSAREHLPAAAAGDARTPRMPSEPFRAGDPPPSPVPDLKLDANYETPDVDVGQVDSPPGMHSKENIAGATASEIAGVQAPRGEFNPFDAAKHIKDGTVEMTLPVEGRVGEGMKSADFPAGTELRVRAEVKDGKVVPDKLKAEFSKPGDAAAWVTAKGAYLDDDNHLRVELGGMYDFSIADLNTKGKSGPPSVGRLMEGVQGLAGDGGGDGPSAFQVDDARISVKDATFQEGKIDVHVGNIESGPNTRFSIEGGLNEATLKGHVDIKALNIAEDRFALKDARGEADVEVSYRKGEDGNHHFQTKLTNLDLESQDMVHTSGSKYFHMEHGRIEGGTLDVQSTVTPDGDISREVNADLPKVNGQLHSARFNVDRDAGDNRVEIGRTGFNGHVRMENDQVTLLKGDVEQLDASVHDVELATGEGVVTVEGARLRGSGHIDMTPERMVAVDGSITAEAVVDRSQVQLFKLGLPVERTILADGKTHMLVDLENFKKLEYAHEVGGPDDSLRTRLAVEGGDIAVEGKMSDIVGRFAVPGS